jgi:adenosylcobinamide-GDP ribazoletransferase
MHSPNDSENHPANHPGAWWADLKVALALLTRLPMGPRGDAEAPDIARAGRVMPIAGALIGLVGAAAFWLSDGLGLPPLVSGLVAVAATILFTGALHEDGLADTADGLGAATEPARRLEIMRDSRTGAYGALALILSVGLRAAALAAIAASGAGAGAEAGAGAVAGGVAGGVAAALISAHALARALPPAVMAWAPLARSDGLAAGAGRPEPAQAWFALGLGALIALLLLDLGTAVAAMAAAGLAAGALVLLARARIGGYTGDVLGAIEQIGEVAVLLAAAAAL